MRRRPPGNRPGGRQRHRGVWSSAKTNVAFRTAKFDGGAGDASLREDVRQDQDPARLADIEPALVRAEIVWRQLFVIEPCRERKSCGARIPDRRRGGARGHGKAVEHEQPRVAGVRHHEVAVEDRHAARAAHLRGAGARRARDEVVLSETMSAGTPVDDGIAFQMRTRLFAGSATISFLS